MSTHFERLAISVHGFLLFLGCPGVERQHLQKTHLSLWLSCLSSPPCLHGTRAADAFPGRVLGPTPLDPMFRQTPVGQWNGGPSPSLAALQLHGWGATGGGPSSLHVLGFHFS